MDLISSLRGISLTKGLLQQWRTKRYRYLTHPRPDHGFLLVTQGEMTYRFDGAALTAEAGDLIFLPSNSRYEVCFHVEKGAVEDLLINFHPSETESLPTVPTRLLRKCPSGIASLLEQTAEAWKKEQEHLALSNFYLFLHRLREQLQPPPDEEALWLERVKEVLIATPPLSMEEIARKMLISQSGLRQKFKSATGLSPTEYRMQRRLERAAESLRTTDTPLDEIAHLCGFYDTASFCRIFKSATGKTPSEYRNEQGIV